MSWNRKQKTRPTPYEFGSEQIFSQNFYTCVLNLLVWEISKLRWLHFFLPDAQPEEDQPNPTQHRKLVVTSFWIEFDICVLKLLVWEDAKSHWSHLLDSSPVCISKCATRRPTLLDRNVVVSRFWGSPLLSWLGTGQLGGPTLVAATPTQPVWLQRTKNNHQPQISVQTTTAAN